MKEKKVNIWKIVIVSACVAATVAAIALAVYRLFKKYFKITFETDDECDSCVDGCFCEDCDDDFIPECSYDEDDLDEMFDEAAEDAE